MDYKDIIDLPHYNPVHHPRMSMESRAAQFAPFAALTGHSAVLAETARVTEKRVYADEEASSLLNRQMQLLRSCLPNRPEVTISYFEPDVHKAGGSFQSIHGRVCKIDDYAMLITLDDERHVNIRNILAIEGI